VIDPAALTASAATASTALGQHPAVVLCLAAILVLGSLA